MKVQYTYLCNMHGSNVRNYYLPLVEHKFCAGASPPKQSAQKVPTIFTNTKDTPSNVFFYNLFDTDGAHEKLNTNN